MPNKKWDINELHGPITTNHQILPLPPSYQPEHGHLWFSEYIDLGE